MKWYREAIWNRSSSKVSQMLLENMNNVAFVFVL